ncbi:hypothetical protein GCM10027053_07470 [Intrasporangium mesophilum]
MAASVALVGGAAAAGPAGSTAACPDSAITIAAPAVSVTSHLRSVERDIVASLPLCEIALVYSDDSSMLGTEIEHPPWLLKDSSHETCCAKRDSRFVSVKAPELFRGFSIVRPGAIQARPEGPS